MRLIGACAEPRPAPSSGFRQPPSAAGGSAAARPAVSQPPPAPVRPRSRWLRCGSDCCPSSRPSRVPRGQRAVGLAPRNRGSNRTLVTSLSLEGAGPGLLLEAALNTAVFDAYVSSLLAPTLRPGQIVVVDNLSAHHGERARAAIE